VSPERVVVLRALGLGDLLTAVPALRGLRAGHPDARVTLAGPAALAPLLPAGLVDDVVDTAPLTPLDPRLHGADLAVNLHGRGPQSTALLQAARPARLVAFGVTSTWRADEHEVLRWCRLLAEAGMPADPRSLDLDPPPVPPAVADAVVVHPGAALPSRLWPLQRWAEVAHGLAADGERVVVTGSPGEAERAARVAELAGLPADSVLAGRTSAVELAALVAAARLLVSVDTGVAHLATGLGTPSVVLFGPTPPALWGPPPDRRRHRVLWAGRCGDNAAPDPDAGLLALQPADVLAEARTLLRLGRHEPAHARTVEP
jgi:ADP-heptose:LPS heptosyltransferase